MKKWVRSGLVWGGILFLITMIIFPLLQGEHLSSPKIAMGVLLWIVVGLSLGYLFKDRSSKKGKPKPKKKKR